MPAHTLAPGADARAVAAVLDAVERDAQEAGLPAATVDRVVLVAGEAVANAVEHGAGPVTVGWESDGTSGLLRVEGGGGPGSKEVWDARLPDVWTATRGRGLFLIAQLADRIDADGGSLDVWFRTRAGEV